MKDLTVSEKTVLNDLTLVRNSGANLGNKIQEIIDTLNKSQEVIDTLNKMIVPVPVVKATTKQTIK